MIRQYFTGTILFAVFSFVVAYLLGGMGMVLITALLAVLETSLSVDNAVVNAAVLRDMEPKWRQRFIVWGIPIAVFGMRVLFPLLIVGIACSIAPMPGFTPIMNWFETGVWQSNDALTLALADHKAYADAVTSAHTQIAGFGGAFLMMVFLNFFLNGNKTEHWLPGIERVMARIGHVPMVAAAITLLMALMIAKFVTPDHVLQFVTPVMWGIVTYVFVDGLGEILGGPPGNAAGNVAKQGFAGFMYLELLDASFSFDGVIGAFVLTDHIVIIALGLGIGAFVVRSLTLLMVDKGTLEQFKFLEHAAYWAIGALAVIMFLGVVFHISEMVTGILGATILAAGIIHSIIHKRKNPEIAVVTVNA